VISHSTVIKTISNTFFLHQSAFVDPKWMLTNLFVLEVDRFGIYRISTLSGQRAGNVRFCVACMVKTENYTLRRALN